MRGVAFAPPPFRPGALFCPGYDWRPYLSEPASPLELRYGSDDWRRRYAQAAYKHLDAADVLSPQIRRKAERDPAGLINQWADELRLLHEQDGYSREEIFETLRWGLSPGSWWMQNRALCSLGALRRKIRSGEKTKFDAMYDQRLSENSHEQTRPERSPATDFEQNRQLARAALGLEP